MQTRKQITDGIMALDAFLSEARQVPDVRRLRSVMRSLVFIMRMADMWNADLVLIRKRLSIPRKQDEILSVYQKWFGRYDENALFEGSETDAAIGVPSEPLAFALPDALDDRRAARLFSELFCDCLRLLSVSGDTGHPFVHQKGAGSRIDYGHASLQFSRHMDGRCSEPEMKKRFSETFTELCRRWNRDGIRALGECDDLMGILTDTLNGIACGAGNCPSTRETAYGFDAADARNWSFEDWVVFGCEALSEAREEFMKGTDVASMLDRRMGYALGSVPGNIPSGSFWFTWTACECKAVFLCTDVGESEDTVREPYASRRDTDNSEMDILVERNRAEGLAAIEAERKREQDRGIREARDFERSVHAGIYAAAAWSAEQERGNPYYESEAQRAYERRIQED